MAPPLSTDPTVHPVLDSAQLAVVETFGVRRTIDVGDYLYRAGDEAYDFFALLSGRVEIFGQFDGDDVEVADLGAGQSLGELGLLTGQRVYLSARVTEAGEAIVVPVDDFRRLMATVPELGDVILTSFVARRAALLGIAADAVRVVGSRFSVESLRLREFLARNRLPHHWMDVDGDPDVEQVIADYGIVCDDLPVAITGSVVLRRSTPGELAQHLGLTIESIPQRCFDLVVVGSGPAGLAAAVYGASEGLSTLSVESLAPGGQAGTSSRIENYLGFPNGISGGDLTDLAMTQALKFGVRFSTPCDVTELDEVGGHLVLRLSDGTEIAARAVVAATGARYRRLAVDDLERFEGKGVYYSATNVEAQLVRGAPAIVVGGGNSAGQAAMFLAQTGCSVTLAVRGNELGKSMSSYLADRIAVHQNIDVRLNTEVSRLEGDDTLEKVTLRTGDDETTLASPAVFSFIGATPSSQWLSGRAALCSIGFILTDTGLHPEHRGERWLTLGREPLPFESSLPGLFAVGDVRMGSMKRVAAAVGEGSGAVRSVHQHLAFSS